jgi:tRNA A-37 threonylcarbamoyl transferase component Bud32
VTLEGLRPATLSGLSDGSASADDRELLQRRLALLGLISLGIYVAFYVGGQAMVAAGREAAWPFTGHVVMAAFMLLAAGLWLYCRRGRRPSSVLRPLEAGLTILAAPAVMLHTTAVIPEPALRAMVMLLATSLALYTRSIFIPSSARRTLVVSALAAAPLAVYSLATEPARLSGWKLMWLGAAVAIATAGSWVIYGLRREVRHARQLGQYTLAEPLGEGGMGVVYRARHAMLRRPTAVKLLRPERVGEADLARFEREVQLTAGLSHPNTVSIYDFGRTPNGIFYYAMEYLEGLDLGRLVDQEGPQPETRVVHILKQVLGALTEAHAVGLIHRDIKPSNIILCERGGLPDVAKVVDFGLVKELGASDDLTRDDTLVGTPLYLAPEAIRSSNVDARSDLYSLGAVAYFLLTGTRVFGGQTVVEICSHHLQTPPEPPSQRLGRPVEKTLEAWVLACLEKDPSRRPRSAAAAAEALDRAAAVGAWNAEAAREWWRTRGRRLVEGLRADAEPSAATLSMPVVRRAEGQA